MTLCTTDLQNLVFLTRFLLSEVGKDCSDSQIGLLCLIRENPWVPCPIAFGLCLRLCRAVASVALWQGILTPERSDVTERQ